MLAGCGGSASAYDGGGDDPSVVDMQYRDWTDDEVDRIKQNAEEVKHDELSRNAEDLVGEPVMATVVVSQRLDADDYDALLLSYDLAGSKLAYGSWTGDTLLRGDVITIWGEVLGEETYETANAGQRTVPALSLAAIERQNTKTGT